MFNESLDNSLTRGNKQEITAWGIPDYTAGVSISESALPSTAPFDMMIYYRCSGSNTNVDFYIEVDGQKIWQGCFGGNVSMNVYAKKGSTLSRGRTGGSFGTLIYFPLIGG